MQHLAGVELDLFTICSHDLVKLFEIRKNSKAST